MDQDATWYGCRPQHRPHCVRWGQPPPKRRTAVPQFSAHVYCGQTAGWIKMPVGMELCLGPGNIVLDRDHLPPKRGTQQPPLLGPFLLWPNGWMDQDTTRYGGRPHPRRHCVTRGQLPVPKGAQPPIFSPYSIVAKQSPMSATAEHL